MKKFILTLSIGLSCLALFSQKSVWIRSSPSNCDDATIRTDLPDNHDWGNDDNIIANAFTAQGNFFIQRSLIRFDLADIPSDARIISAKLNLWCNVESGHHQLQYGDNQSFLSRITQPWDENLVTWNNQPEFTSEKQVQLFSSQSRTEDYLDIDITDFIKDMIELKHDNYGLMLHLMTEETYRTLLFASSDYYDTNRRPLLIVEYIGCDKPNCDFNYSLNDNVVTFENLSTASTDWYWDFGDGYFSNLENPNHAYHKSGLYNVCLISYNECSSDTLCKVVSTCSDLSAGFSYSMIADSGVQFYDTSKYATHWFWDFDDGFYSDLQYPLHQFNRNGLYNVCLYITNDCEYDTICQALDLRFYGFENTKLDSDIGLSPNPSSGPFRIIYPEKITIQSISIFNIKGQEVYFHNADQDKGLIVFPDPGTGMFLIRIRTNEGIVLKKLISD